MTNFDKYYFKRFKRLDKTIRVQTNKLFDLYNVILSSQQRSSLYWNGILKQIDEVYNGINVAYTKWNKLEIPAVYKKELLFLDKKIKSTKRIVNQSKKNVTALINSQSTNQLTTALVSDSIVSMRSALNAGQKNFNRFTRMTQQNLIADYTVNQSVILGIETGNLKRGTSQLYNILKTKLGDKKYVEVNGRNYKPRYYAEMVTRTKFHEAQSFAAVNTSLNYSNDFVRVSNHNTTTVICQQFEGKIYSISGQSKIFPKLLETSPYHPNCLHLIFPEFIQGYSEKDVKGLSEFSKGTIDRPPFPKGFIPVDKRGEL